MPTVVVTETEKRDVDGEKKDFEIKSIKIESASKAIIESISSVRATGINRALKWTISSYGRESGDKLKFSIEQVNDWLKRPTNSLILEGDLLTGFGCLKGNFVSDSTYKKLLEELSKFTKSKTEEKENIQTMSYKK